MNFEAPHSAARKSSAVVNPQAAKLSCSLLFALFVSRIRFRLVFGFILMSGDIVIYQNRWVSAECSYLSPPLPRPGVGVRRTAYPRLRRGTGVNAT